MAPASAREHLRSPKPRDVKLSKLTKDPTKAQDPPAAGERIAAPTFLTAPGLTHTVPAAPERVAAPTLNVGLGVGVGGQLARGCLVATGAALLDKMNNQMHQKGVSRQEYEAQQLLSSTEKPSVGIRVQSSLVEDGEPKGMWKSLLMNDSSPVSHEDLMAIRDHRWTFMGAVEMAMQGKGLCFLIQCLLEIQRNVQMSEELEPLKPQLADACRSFVRAQCREGKEGDMYHLMSHFLCNSVIFYEWERFLKTALEKHPSGQDPQLVLLLEQVWTRFCRLRDTLERLFEILNVRFVWRHRLPSVGDLLKDHMRRRCFSSETVVRHDIFQQAHRTETVKQMKFAFGLM